MNLKYPTSFWHKQDLTFPGAVLGPDLGLHVQAKACLMGVHLLLQLLLGQFQLRHLTGHPLLVHLLLTLALNLPVLKTSSLDIEVLVALINRV